MKTKTLTLSIFIIIILSLPAMAFDGNRKGFIIGVGAGVHRVDIDTDDNSDIDPEFGLATSLKIGCGITDQFTLYYVRNASWFKLDGMDDDIIFVTGISGIGATYYFSPSAPSGYIFGAVGMGDIATPFEDDNNSETGSAFMAGAGYEFSPHVHLELTALKTNIDDADLETTSLQLTFNYLWY